jgi:hypothetical protein
MNHLESLRFRRALRTAIQDAVTQSMRQVFEEYGLTMPERRSVHVTPQLPKWYSEWSELLNEAFPNEYQRLTWTAIFTVLGVEDSRENRHRIKPILKALDFRQITVISEDGVTRVKGWARGRSHRSDDPVTLREITG